MSFLMIVSLAYVTIETVDPEPAFASSQHLIVLTDGNPYRLSNTWNTTLQVTNVRWVVITQDGTNGDSSPATPSATFDIKTFHNNQ